MIFKWILSGIICAGIIITILEIGKQKKPTTPVTASLVTIINAILVYGLWNWM